MSEALSVRVRASVWISSSPSGMACLRELMSRRIRYFPRPGSLGAVGLDEALVDAPGGRNRSVALVGEQRLETLGLGVGEQAGPGQQGAPGTVEPVARPAPPARDRSLDAAAALIECLPAARDTTRAEIHDRPGLWDLLASGAPGTR